MKTFVYIALCVLFALVVARESQVSTLEDLLEAATLASQKTVLKQANGEKLLEMIETMKLKLKKDEKTAIERFTMREEARDREERKAKKEEKALEASLESVKAKNKKLKADQEKTYNEAMGVLKGDDEIVKALKGQVALLKKYKISHDLITAQLKKIVEEVEGKRKTLKATLKQQEADRKTLRDSAEAALKKQSEAVKKLIARNDRLSKVEKKNLEDVKKAVAEEGKLLVQIERILTGADKREREEAERKAREAAKKAREAAEARRREQEKREAAAARQRAAAAARKRADDQRRSTYVHANDNIWLQGAHGKWLVAESNHQLNANRGHSITWETFKVQLPSNVNSKRILKYGDTVSLRSYWGKYVVAEGNGHANANRPWRGAWEKFIVYKYGNTGSRGHIRWGDRIGFFNPTHRRWMVAENTGHANFNRGHFHSWESFRVTKSKYNTK